MQRTEGKSGEPRKLTELATLVEGELVGDPYLTIRGVAPLGEAGPAEITFAADLRRAREALAGGAGAVILARSDYAALQKEAEVAGRPVVTEKSLLLVDNPRLAFARVLAAFAPPLPVAVGVHPTAVISPQARLGRNVAIGAHVVIEAEAEVGDGVVIYPGVYLGPGVRVGAGSIIHANAVLREGVRVGRNVVIHAGAVLGADGFGFVPVEGKHRKVPQIGTVVVEDDVEIGANTTIDRATCGATRIGRGTKIDNLVQIGHNVQVGEDCLIVAQCGLAGSARLGDRVILAGQAGVADHLEVGDDCVVAAASVVASDLPPGSHVFGIPARPHAEEMRIKAASARLPELWKELRQLRRRLEELEKASKGT